MNRKTGHVYTPKATREYEESVAWSARASRVSFGDRSVWVKITLVFNRAPRGDIDNFEKAILDGLEKGQLFDNDRQVLQKSTRVIIGYVGEEHAVVQVGLL